VVKALKKWETRHWIRTEVRIEEVSIKEDTAYNYSRIGKKEVCKSSAKSGQKLVKS
jgi:hypothetical protein